MGERKVLVALVSSLVALSYVAAVHVVAAIKYFDKDDKKEEKDDEEKK